MPAIALQDITEDNWHECTRLRLKPEQQHFVAANAFSLAQAAYQRNWIPQAIYAADDMVGFVMYGLYDDDGRTVWAIVRLMVDERYQGKGYGRATMLQVLEQMRTHESSVRDVYISFVPDNEAARRLYTDLGFVDVGMTSDGEEVLMHLQLSE